MQVVFPRTPPIAVEARGGPRKAESVAKGLSPTSSVSTAQLEGEAGSRGWRAPRSLPASLPSCSTVPSSYRKEATVLKLYLYRDATTPRGESSYNLYIYVHIYIYILKKSSRKNH